MAAVEVDRLVVRRRRPPGGRRDHLHRRPRAGPRPARPQRRRQDHDGRDASRACWPRPSGSVRVLGLDPHRRPRAADAPHRGHAPGRRRLPRRPADRDAAAGGLVPRPPGRPRRAARPGRAQPPGPAPPGAPSPAASSSACRSPSPWSAGPRSSCSTSPPPASTRRAASSSASWSPT